MTKLNLFICILMMTLAVSCEPGEEEEKPLDCPVGFLQSYNGALSAFRQAYRPDALPQDKDQLEFNLKDFLAKFHSKTCKMADGKVLNPTSEIKQFLAENKRQNKTFASPLSFTSLTQVREMFDKVIYGLDNRVDPINSSNANFKMWAKSTAAQIPNNNIDQNLNIATQTLGESMSLCSDQRFAHQIAPARCSGFLVAPDILVTAGHCMRSSSDCSDSKWVFDFTEGTRTLDADDVYGCKEIIKQELNSGRLPNIDYAVIKLDRPVTGRKPLKFRTSGKISDGTPLVVIGHPSGLPTKISDGAVVRNNNPVAYFSSNLDTFGGNSGSAVFNVNTGEVEGILVRGETDYVISSNPDGGTCRKVKECANTACRGEDVTRITQVLGLPQVDPVDPVDPVAPVAPPMSQSTLFSRMYQSQDLPLGDGGGVINFMTYKYGDFQLSGKKFLGLCGLHLAHKDYLNDWLNFALVDCGFEMNKLDSVYSEFVSIAR